MAEQETVVEIKRKPGRPSNAEKAAREAAGENRVFDSGAAPETPAAARPKKKAGAKELTQADIDKMAQGIFGLHLMAAKMTGIPEAALQTNESEALAVSVLEVQREFGFTVNPKAAAITGLLMTAGMIYGPRVLAVRARAEKAREEAEEAAKNATLQALQENGIPAPAAPN